MYTATPTDLINQIKADRARMALIAGSALRQADQSKMVVAGGRLMMILERQGRSVTCVRITGTGTLAVDQFSESSVTPMDLAYSPRTLLPEARDIPEGLLLQLEEDDMKRREERRRKSRKPKRGKRIKDKA